MKRSVVEVRGFSENHHHDINDFLSSSFLAEAITCDSGICSSQERVLGKEEIATLHCASFAMTLNCEFLALCTALSRCGHILDDRIDDSTPNMSFPHACPEHS